MSGGHYPPSYHHIQPPQEFIAPRHRLPLIPPQRPPSSYNPPSSISNAHTSHTSWMNKNNFPNFHENSSFYSQTSPKNYSPRGILNEENKWSEPPFSNSASTTNASYRCSPDNDKMEQRTCSNVYSKEDVQQESMDLSSAAHVSTITSPKTNTEASINPVNGNPNDDGLEKDVPTSMNGATAKSDIKQTSSKKEAVSVIAPNPLREKSSHIVSAGSIIKSAPPVHEPVIKSSKDTLDEMVKITKQEKKIIPPDHVESILETMFHSDSKSSATPAVSSVIVTAQSCNTSNDLRAESVEKILKSPSPERSYDLSLESDSELNSSELDNTKGDRPSRVSSSKIDLTNERKANFTLSKSCDVVDNGMNLVSKTECVKNNTHAESIADSVSEKVDNKVSKNVDKDLGLLDESEDESELENDESNLPTESNNGATDLSSKTKKCDIPESVSEQEYLKSLEEDHIVVEVDLERGKKLTDESNIKLEPPIKSKKRDEEITYVEVETELEKMFAGIEETDADPSNVLATDTSVTDTSKIDASNVTSDVSFSQPVSTSENLPPPTKSKKKSSKKSKSSSTKKDAKSKHSSTSKDHASSDGVICKRVPVIHVEGSKENPISVQIINSIKSEEDDISDAKTAAKRKQGKCDKANKRFAASYTVKNYDPESSDESWICIFCKQSAHSPGVAGEPTGELFGPYFIKDPYQSDAENDLKRHSRKTEHFNDQIKKKKRSLSLESNHNVSSAPERKTMEIWAHENCFIWATGIHLIGSKLMGLENAVIESLQTICAHCNQSGAGIGCRTRHCRSFVHYSCALHTGWKLDPETFIAVCNLHKGTH